VDKTVAVEEIKSNINIFFLFLYMGCKLSISVVHPSKSPKSPKRKSSKDIPESPIFIKNKTPDVDSDSDSYTTLYIDTPPDSERKRV